MVLKMIDQKKCACGICFDHNYFRLYFPSDFGRRFDIAANSKTFFFRNQMFGCLASEEFNFLTVIKWVKRFSAMIHHSRSFNLFSPHKPTHQIQLIYRNGGEEKAFGEEINLVLDVA